MRVAVAVPAALLLAGVFALAGASGVPSPTPPPAAPSAPGAVLWGERSGEVVVQGFVLLASVLGVLALLGAGVEKGREP